MKNVLISGAGIAGPALAAALGRRGFGCTIVERAPALRVGGQAVDFRGPVHRQVLDRMELWGALSEQRTTPTDLVMLDQKGARVATLPAVMTAGDLEIVRGDLCRILHERTRETTDYRFGDFITAIDDGPNGARVSFASGRAETFDIVVGADGLHSGVRALVFGDERQFLRHHGYRIASFAVPPSLGDQDESFVYSIPGRGASLGAGRALLVFAAEPMGADRRDEAAQKRAVRQAFAGMGWKVPAILDALDGATDLYVDDIATVSIDRYARGRVVLLGDAAYGGTLGGQGSSLGIVGAHILAGELAGDVPISHAFSRYEEAMRPYATRCQKGAANAGMFFAPKTRIGLAIRNLMYAALTSRWLSSTFERMVKAAATDLRLPQYTDPA